MTHSTQDVQGQGKCPDLLGRWCWQQGGLIRLGGVAREVERMRSSLHLKAGRPAGWEARSTEQRSTLTLVPGLASLGGIPSEDDQQRGEDCPVIFLLVTGFSLLPPSCFFLSHALKKVYWAQGKNLERGEEVK